MSGKPTPASGGNRLDIREPAGMRAMAHPARLAALQHLMNVGPATATELGAVTGLTASAMSYHLRSLERTGLVETAPSRGDGRERLWRSTHGGYTVESTEDGSAEMREASRELIEAVLMVQEMQVRAWLARGDTEPGWLDTGYFAEIVLIVTPEEMTELGHRLVETLRPYSRAVRIGAPPGARSMTAVFRGFPIDIAVRADPPISDASPATEGLPEESAGLPGKDMK